MKNETISRVILVLEIAAIILFHSLRSTPTASNNIVQVIKAPHPYTFQQSTQLVITNK